MELILDTAIWLRGEGREKSRLHRDSDGKECCVGQWCKQLGVPVQRITELKTVAGLKHNYGSAPSELFYRDSDEIESSWVRTCYEINDNPHTTDAEKIAALRDVLAKQGHTLRVIDSSKGEA